MRMGVRLANILGGRCEVWSSDQRVYVPRPKKFYTYPDGGVVCGKPEYHPRGGKLMVLTNPVLLCEVLSPGTARYESGDEAAALPAARHPAGCRAHRSHAAHC